jgi:hypothetical protein
MQLLGDGLFFRIPGRTILKALENDDPASGAPAISPTDVGQGNAGPDGGLKDGFTFLNLDLLAVRQILNYGHIKGNSLVVSFPFEVSLTIPPPANEYIGPGTGL